MTVLSLAVTALVNWAPLGQSLRTWRDSNDEQHPLLFGPESVCPSTVSSLAGGDERWFSGKATNTKLCHTRMDRQWWNH